MGTEHHTHTPIQCGVSVVRQLTCLLHNRAPTPRPNAPDESVHALLHMSYLYTAPKTRLVKNTTPVNYSLRNIPKQRGERVRLHRNRPGEITVNNVLQRCCSPLVLSAATEPKGRGTGKVCGCKYAPLHTC